MYGREIKIATDSRKKNPSERILSHDQLFAGRDNKVLCMMIRCYGSLDLDLATSNHISLEKISFEEISFEKLPAYNLSKKVAVTYLKS